MQRVPGRASSCAECITALREQLSEAVGRYGSGRFGPNDAARLEEALAALGQTPFGAALHGLAAESKRLLWIPDGPFHGLPVAALPREGRYLVEKVELLHAFSGSLVVHQARTKRPGRRRGPSLVVTESPEVLEHADDEGKGVGAALGRVNWLRGEQASRSAIRPLLADAPAAHFACHAIFDPEHTLEAHLHLPSGEGWRLVEWLDEHVAGLPLLTLSACRSAEVTPLAGREVFGLVTGAMAAGVRAVLAGLWPVADRFAVPFMWRFYRHRLTSDLATALARAQRDQIAEGVSPLFWAVFALFGDAAALPAPSGWLQRWWRRWRAARHARRYPGTVQDKASQDCREAS